MRRSFASVLLVAMPLIVPPMARAGALSTSVEGYGQQTITYEAAPNTASSIAVRSLPSGTVVLTDRSSTIHFKTPYSPLKCVVRKRRTAICGRTRGEGLLSQLKIVGSTRNDTIDARSMRVAYEVLLEGSGGNDTLLAPRHPLPGDGSTLVGGPGRNVLVGGPGAVVSYAGVDSAGPVRVDLARGEAIAPREHDRLVNVANVQGNPSVSREVLVGSFKQHGEISGIGPYSRVVTNAANTLVLGASPDGIIECKAVAEVEPEQVENEILRGRCEIDGVKLTQPMRSLKAAALTVDGQATVQEWTYLEHEAAATHVVMSAAGTTIGEATAKPNHEAEPCVLNASGVELLRHSGRLRVSVSIYGQWPVGWRSGDIYEAPYGLVSRFETVLAVR